MLFTSLPVEGSSGSISAPESGSYFWDVKTANQTQIMIQQTLPIPAGTLINIGFSFAYSGTNVDIPIYATIFIGGYNYLEIASWDTFNYSPGWISVSSNAVTLPTSNPLIVLSLSWNSDAGLKTLEAGADSVFVTIDDGSGFAAVRAIVGYASSFRS